MKLAIGDVKVPKSITELSQIVKELNSVNNQEAVRSIAINYAIACYYPNLVSTSRDEVRGCSYGSELARLGGLALLREMIFIPRSCGIFYLSSIKKFVKKIV